jgi:hypothetical protein
VPISYNGWWNHSTNDGSAYLQLYFTSLFLLATFGSPSNCAFAVTDHPSTSPLFSMTPATRAAVIIGGIMFSGIALSVFWVGKEALRIKRAREATTLANSISVGEMVWIPGGNS